MLFCYPANGTTGIQMLSRISISSGLAMQHDEKLGTMKLMMLSRQGGYHGTSILFLILVQYGGRMQIMSSL
jgi:hypothetical protein